MTKFLTAVVAFFWFARWVKRCEFKYWGRRAFDVVKSCPSSSLVSGHRAKTGCSDTHLYAISKNFRHWCPAL